MIDFCNDNNPKIILVEFDTGSLLKRTDKWKLCFKCNSKPQFQRFRISEKSLGDNQH